MKTFLASAYDESGNPLSKIQVYVGQDPEWDFPYPDGVTSDDGTARIPWVLHGKDTGVATATFVDPTGTYETIVGPIVDANALNVVGVKMRRVAPGAFSFLCTNVLVSLSRDDVKNLLASLSTGIAPAKDIADRLAMKLVRAIST